MKDKITIADLPGHAVYWQAVKMALKVEFLENSEEIKLYADALYSAMMWGEEIDRKNIIIREKGLVCEIKKEARFGRFFIR